jgi:hypothetical protein
MTESFRTAAGTQSPTTQGEKPGDPNLFADTPALTSDGHVLDNVHVRDLRTPDYAAHATNPKPPAPPCQISRRAGE